MTHDIVETQKDRENGCLIGNFGEIDSVISSNLISSHYYAKIDALCCDGKDDDT
jgi:hypothetical protein